MKKIDFSRRNLLQLGALSLVSGSFITTMNKAISQEVVSQNEIQSELTPDKALELLLEGNDRFINNKVSNNNRSLSRVQQVAVGQNPFGILLSCADSRVPVEILFDRGFGDLFVVRNAGNIATSEEVGSIEFGSLVLGAKVILVLGHGNCGAVKAALEGNPVPDNIQSILDVIKPAFNDLTPEQKKDIPTAIKANVKLQIETLKKSSVITKLIEENKLKIVGGYYDLNTGKVSLI
ncbi:carbonic anhydrase [Geminocystis sp. NIES-3709]|uniref:carbonic anhydrase n=1 Tax=Geminocystis sp. NIES-3709 TaxID=1617448 RepID=UPI0005FC828D|nr:carbonic anhydrase [Geminocystis sp. NIES-3709]BAQ63434.1 carbonic anhydrase [Geminocystis sp. NIES-3709]